MDFYRTIYKEGAGEIVEKKSRFIAEAYPVAGEEEAFAHLEEVKKRYWDARHHCWAYVTGRNPGQERMSDDGEPAGTAGKPILEVIRGRELTDIFIVVTRYFGGILLGTGGLVRAYSGAVQEGLRASRIIEKKQGTVLKVITDYTGIGKIQYIAGEKKIPILNSEYTDKVMLELLVPAQETDAVQKAITEGTNGRARMEKDRELYFAVLDGETFTFDK